MKFSRSWLEEWVNPIPEDEEFFHQLTMAGLEVDGYEKLGKGLSGVVVAEIEEITSVADSDHLNCCTVRLGAEVVQVVCGAPNARVGLKTALATVGTNLKGELEIKKAKLRGVESEGMLCSASELGIGDDDAGIMEFPASCILGEEISKALSLDDTIIDLDLTPNRGDCLSIRGIAREVGVLNALDVKEAEVNEVESTINDMFSVSLESPEDCPIYIGRVIKGIDTNLQAPLWMQEKLRRCGLRSIDPVVDVTNFVMLELGQPMHAFDLSKLAEEIIVRKADENEVILLLDDSEIQLDSNALVIADSNKPIALAGVMGGLESGVTDATVDLFLEAAFFTPLSVAGTARRFGLQTDASHRFERGVDLELQVVAMQRATELLLEIVGGKAGPIIESRAENALRKTSLVSLSSNRLNDMLGIEVDVDQVDQILTRLGFSVETKNIGESDVIWLVKSPSHRFDINLEADLVEEVCRVYGYENIPVKLPLAQLALRTTSERQISDFELKKHVAGLGFQEVITYSFVDPKLMQVLDPQVELLSLQNPMSSDQSVMRSNLFPGLVQAVHSNKSRQQDFIRLFELGSVFRLKNNELIQAEVLSGVLWGFSAKESWSEQQRQVDFYDVKGCVDYLVNLVGVAQIDYRKTTNPVLHPGQGADIFADMKRIGHFGKLHPSISAGLELEDLYVFEIDGDFVRTKERRFFSLVSKFPSVRRDISVLIDESIEVAEVTKIAEEVLGELLVGSIIFDLYQGEGIPDSQKSVGLGLTLQSQKETLKEQEINDLASHVLKALQKKLGATLR